MNQPTHSTLVGYIAWIFGFMGAHRFYFGKRLTGLLWALTLGLFGIGWLVDLFLIPGMNKAAAEQYTPGRCDYSVAFILHFFLGVFGVHRFYIGKPLTGILYLFTAGLLGIGWLYDLFTINEQVDERNRATA